MCWHRTIFETWVYVAVLGLSTAIADTGKADELASPPDGISLPTAVNGAQPEKPKVETSANQEREHSRTESGADSLPKPQEDVALVQTLLEQMKSLDSRLGTNDSAAINKIADLLEAVPAPNQKQLDIAWHYNKQVITLFVRRAAQGAGPKLAWKQNNFDPGWVEFYEQVWRLPVGLEHRFEAKRPEKQKRMDKGLPKAKPAEMFWNALAKWFPDARPAYELAFQRDQAKLKELKGRFLATMVKDRQTAERALLRITGKCNANNLTQLPTCVELFPYSEGKNRSDSGGRPLKSQK